MSGPLDATREALVEFAPMLQRAVRLDPASLVRIRIGDGRVTALVRLPFAVLASRTVNSAGDRPDDDLTVGAAELLAHLDGGAVPRRRDLHWRHSVPPVGEWRRIEAVPDDVVRSLVRAGALTLRQAAEREGVPAAQPRTQVTNALLDAVVLDASNSGDGGAPLTAQVALRPLSALIRMGFVPRDSHVGVDLCGGWLRLAAMYGSVYAERPGHSLQVTPR